jgi:hypothetical protein
MSVDRQSQFQAMQLSLQTDSDAITSFQLELIAAGFDIIPFKKWQQPPYCYFSCYKDGRFLYVQKAAFSEGWAVSSIYLPSHEHGTGRGLIESAPLTLATIESAMSMQQSFNPEVHPKPTDAKFYRGLAHYLEFNKNDFA